MCSLNRVIRSLAVLFIVAAGVPSHGASQQPTAPTGGTKDQTSVRRALAYLSREVPQWYQQHDCYSCHNNGDACRALFFAVKEGSGIDADAYRDTLAFLSAPDRWEKNGPEGDFNDRTLARLQFAVALGAAVDAGLVRDQKIRTAAAELLAQDQIADGSWDFVGADELGSPITYGRPLATALAAQTLGKLDANRFAQQIAAAGAWLRSAEPKSVINAAAILIGIGAADDEPARKQRDACLAILKRGEVPEGGWGPYVHSAPEPFDTALVLLALARENRSGWRDAIRRGRDYLMTSQLSDGSWPETTRPALRESYAHRLSTSGWATMALIASQRE